MHVTNAETALNEGYLQLQRHGTRHLSNRFHCIVPEELGTGDLLVKIRYQGSISDDNLNLWCHV